jgi:hypothetical protein
MRSTFCIVFRIKIEKQLDICFDIIPGGFIAIAGEMHWYPASNENTGSVEIRTNTYTKFLHY